MILGTKAFSFIIICLIIPSSLVAWDINLDEIYIKRSSYLKRLTLKKLDTYQKINATFVDSDVIFAGWISGDEILYIKESPKLNINIIYKYRLSRHSSIELYRLYGVITVARMSFDRRYLILKTLVQRDGIIPKGEMVIFNIQSRRLTREESDYPFLDFSIPDGNVIVFERDRRIIELSLDSRISRILLKRSGYSDIIISKNPSIAYYSPDRQKVLVINGSGGNYRAKVFQHGEPIRVNGITSSSEIFWIDNYRIAFRTGSTGNFSVVLYDIKKNEMIKLLKKSFNTNITFSLHANILSFLEEQLIQLYNISQGRLIQTGIEGEDIYFSPNGNRFTSIMYKKLFIININILREKRVELKRVWRSILSIYRELRNKRHELENEYSIYYIIRKIEVYKRLSKI